MMELLEPFVQVSVAEAEFRRLLGYPPDYVPGAQAKSIEDSVRAWYAEHGKPWLYVRECPIKLTGEHLHIGGKMFCSARMRSEFARAGTNRAVLIAVSAGRTCEEEARRRWEEGKPDEYFFLETFGSAVVEHLVAKAYGRVCEWAQSEGLAALPRHSPGYSGWDVAEQVMLLEVISGGKPGIAPEALETLSSGMLRPKKSLLAVVGLSGISSAPPRAASVPCTNCSLSPCQFRRLPRRYASRRPALGIGSEPLSTPE